MQILIVDDEQTNIELIKAVFKGIECEFTVCHDGQEGLAKAQELIPDLVILDVMMPKLDGFKVCAHLKADSRFKNIPIFILSSRAGDDDFEVARQVDADCYMLKLVDYFKLRSEVDKLFNLAGDNART